MTEKILNSLFDDNIFMVMYDILVFGIVYSTCGGFLLARPLVSRNVFSDFKPQKFQGFWHRSTESVFFKRPEDIHAEIQEGRRNGFELDKIKSQTALVGIIALVSGGILQAIGLFS